MNEIWLPVVGFEGLYEVSDRGGIRSLDRVITAWNASAGRFTQRKIQGRVLSPGRVGSYLRVTLYGNGIKRQDDIHRIVLEAFVGPCPVGLEACHLNDIGTDNRLANLRWDTHGANERDKVRNGNHHLASKTHCKNSHEFTAENTRITKHGYRECKQCHRDYNEALPDEVRKARNRDAQRRSKQRKRLASKA
jgi:hypothetical protein